jgi:hypothetical protein
VNKRDTPLLAAGLFIPSTEVNIAFGGRIMSNVGRNLEDVLGEVLELLYRPKDPGAHQKLVEIFQRAEKGYFDQWNAQRIQEYLKRPIPGEFSLCSIEGPFGLTPGASSYLMEPFLDSEGRRAYKQVLVSILKYIMQIEGDFEDNGRMERIKKGIEEALVDINNIAFIRNEKQTWDEVR